MAQAGDPLGLQGTVIDGKYVLGRAAGEGGAAIVYRAENTVWQVPVAVKFFVALSQAAPNEQASLLADFTQEGRLVADLSTRCSAIVQPRDFGVLRRPGHPALPYLVLEWLDGKSLDDVLVSETRAKMSPRTLDEAMRLLEPVASALSLAHELGVAHRDIKPENMMVVGDARGPDAQIKLLDFGIAKVMKRRLDGVHQTGTMPTAFTPHYGAPEQFSRGFGETGPWTDVFALALVVLEVMRGGARAFSGDDYVDLGQQSMDESTRPTPRKLELTVSDDVEAVFQRALSVQPQHRYQDVRSFWQALVGASRPGAPAWRPPGQSIPPPAAASSPAVRPVAPRRSIVYVAAALGLLLIVGAAIAAGLRAASRETDAAARASSPAGASSGDAAPAIPTASASASVEASQAALCPDGSVIVSGGRFHMGTSADVSESTAPEHVVYVDTFCLDRAEVTVGSYEKCLELGTCQPPAPGCRATPEPPTLPMTCVTHGEAEAFCASREMRLPTEAEWEYAASSPRKDEVLDLASGVAEWVSDFMGPYPEGQQVNPKGPETGTERVIRGSALRIGRVPRDKQDAVAKLVPKIREGAPAEQRAAGVGFRCAKSIR